MGTFVAAAHMCGYMPLSRPLRKSLNFQPSIHINMTTDINIKNRRSFIKITALAGGGIMMGFHLPGCKPESKRPSFVAPSLEEPEVWADINGYIKIGNNGVVTIMSPNPEIGQNVKTAMPMIVAEELDADWDKVIVEQAPLDTDNFSRQLAGGSQSIRYGWESLRKAGATARRILLEAAAKEWQVPVAELTTSKGVISHALSGKSMHYGEIVGKTETIEIPEDIALKDPKDFSIIGKPTRNVDGFGIVGGKPLFGLDIQREGMLIAMIEHPPAFGMKIAA